jgi:hypothetical protein
MTSLVKEEQNPFNQQFLSFIFRSTLSFNSISLFMTFQLIFLALILLIMFAFMPNVMANDPLTLINLLTFTKLHPLLSNFISVLLVTSTTTFSFTIFRPRFISLITSVNKW